MAHVADRLRQLMTERGIDQPTLAEAVGCSQGAISQILSGTTQRSRFLPDIADYFGVSLRWLKGESAERALSDVALPSPEAMARELDLVGIGEIDLAYGMGGTFVDQEVEVTVHHFPRVWVESISRGPPALLTIARGRGDSMEPTIHDGDMVIINRAERTIREQDALWALAIGDIGMIKRLRIRGEKVTILSDNGRVPSDEAHVDEITIVGRIDFVGSRK